MPNEKKFHPMQSGGSYGSVDVDLGGGVGIRYVESEGERVGGILVHEKPDSHQGKCEGGFWFKDNAFHAKYPNQKATQWDFNGDFESPTLHPSFLCHCGFHGWVRDGKWVNA